MTEPEDPCTCGEGDDSACAHHGFDATLAELREAGDLIAEGLRQKLAGATRADVMVRVWLEGEMPSGIVKVIRPDGMTHALGFVELRPLEGGPATAMVEVHAQANYAYPAHLPPKPFIGDSPFPPDAAPTLAEDLSRVARKALGRAEPPEGTDVADPDPMRLVRRLVDDYADLREAYQRLIAAHERQEEELRDRQVLVPSVVTLAELTYRAAVALGRISDGEPLEAISATDPDQPIAALIDAFAVMQAQLRLHAAIRVDGEHLESLEVMLRRSRDLQEIAERVRLALGHPDPTEADHYDATSALVDLLIRAYNRATGERATALDNVEALEKALEKANADLRDAKTPTDLWILARNYEQANRAVAELLPRSLRGPFRYVGRREDMLGRTSPGVIVVDDWGASRTPEEIEGIREAILTSGAQLLYVRPDRPGIVRPTAHTLAPAELAPDPGLSAELP